MANDIMKQVLSVIGPGKRAYPAVYYDKDENCIEVLLTPEPFHAEQLSEELVGYYNEKGKLIGICLLKVQELMRTMVEFDDGFVHEDKSFPQERKTNLHWEQLEE